MLNITLDLDTGLAKLAAATTIKAGAQVPVTITTVRGATPASPGASPYFEIGLGTDATPSVNKAYLDDFTAENDHTFTGVLDANDTRLVTFMSGKGTVNFGCEVAWTVAGQLEVAPTFMVPVQSRVIPSDPTSEGGPDFYTETEVDALLAAAAALTARAAQVALVAATGNLTLSGTQTIDGVAVIAGDIVFAKSQTTAGDRKRYTVAAGAWTAIDQPRAVAVQKGTVNGGLLFVLSAANTYTAAGDSAGGPTYTTVADADARYALDPAPKAGDILLQSDTNHRWLVCDVTKLTDDRGYQDLGVVPGVLFATGVTSISGWSITGGTFTLIGDVVTIDTPESVTEITIPSNACTGPLNASICPSLSTLDCSDNNLTNLNVSGCTSLMSLVCSGCDLYTLDVSGLTSLVYLNCASNALFALDVSGCTSLTTLLCQGNYLSALDVGGRTSLITLNCASNAITVEADVDAIFIALDANGAINGTADTSGGTNAVPGAGSATERATLITDGWTLVTN